MKNVYSLFDSVAQDIQLDVYNLFDEGKTKHALLEEIVAAIIAGLVLEYLNALLDLKGIGVRRRQWFQTHLSQLQKNQQISSQDTESAAKDALVEIAKSPVSDSEHSQAQAALSQELEMAGVAKSAAQRVSQKVSRQVAGHLKT